jgi:Spy/CpxP family protein refolding chaperone
LPAVDSVKKQLARMTHRYGLTSSQQETIRPILDAERRRTAELFADTSIPQGEKLARAKSIRGDASEKIAAVLTDAQRTKFEQDEARRDAREQQDGMDMEGPPPPPPDGSGPPPP